MKPEAGARRNRDGRSDIRVSTGVGPQPVETRLRLNEEQRQVLECLEKAGSGLTISQIESKMTGIQNVDDTLAVLLERQLVSRLNTLVPSYIYRHPDSKVDAE